MANATFTLRAHFVDGFAVTLPGEYAEQWRAERAAEHYIRDYSDPCGIGSKVSHVSIIEGAAR